MSEHRRHSEKPGQPEAKAEAAEIDRGDCVEVALHRSRPFPVGPTLFPLANPGHSHTPLFCEQVLRKIAAAFGGRR